MKPDVRGIVPHLVYEWEMLCWTYKKLFSTEAQGLQELPVQKLHNVGTSMYYLNPLGSAVLESFLLHVRVLRDFLWKDTRDKQDDVLAIDFFDNEEHWRRARTEMGSQLRSGRNRLNKALAHLSYSRTIPGESVDGWDVDGIQSEVKNGWEAFLATLPPDTRSWFTAKLGGTEAGP